ncbi:leucine-rich PPR motif-containing protein, mitochondrial-like isoform X2 [Planococcus citri]|uniref:leucine-rich PPR motif-containing protein, mitochondrial-like isoform X2 n=1 Tax=Planococcus citri TaxID=170843 RepID=UPI0031F72D60
MLSKALPLAWKHSVKALDCTRTTAQLISRNVHRMNQFQNNTFHTDVPHLSDAKIEKQIERLDLDARRNGRISLREVENLLGEIKLNRSASLAQSAMVIRCCGSLISEESPEKRTELVQEVWNTLEKLGIDLDISHYNALLRVYLENEYQWVPSEILAELEQKGLEPNKVTYTRLISRYCQLADIEGATRILQFMREKDMSINEVVFNALILGHSRANDMGSAEEILNIMRQAGQKPSPETYTLLACCYVAQGNMNKVKSILEDCEKRDIPLSVKDYMDIVYQMSLKDLDIDEMLSKIPCNTPYNQESINCIYKLVDAGKIEHAYKIIKSMVRSTRLVGSLSPTGGCFVDALVRNERPSEEIIEYCDKLVKENLNALAFSTAMERSLKYKKESLVYELFKAAKKRNMTLRPHYFWPLIVARGVLVTSNVNTVQLPPREQVKGRVAKGLFSFESNFCQTKNVLQNPIRCFSSHDNTESTVPLSLYRDLFKEFQKVSKEKEELLIDKCQLQSDNRILSIKLERWEEEIDTLIAYEVMEDMLLRKGIGNLKEYIDKHPDAMSTVDFNMLKAFKDYRDKIVAHPSPLKITAED